MLVRIVLLALLLVNGALAGASVVGARLPDSGQIAFHSNRDGDDDIYLLDVGSRLQINLTRGHSAYDSTPAWSPDGARLAFTSSREFMGDSRRSIYVMNFDGSGLMRLTQLTSRKAVWAPDGERIAFSTPPDYIVVAPLSGIGEYVLGPGYSPDWSPDGTQIVADVSLAAGFIRVLAPDGSTTRDLIPGSPYFSEPDWAPDSRTLAFASNVVGGFDVFLLDSRCAGDCGEQMRRLTDGASEDFMPDWSPDGTRIAYVCSIAGRSDLCLIGVDGGMPQRLTSLPAGASLGSPAWRP